MSFANVAFALPATLQGFLCFMQVVSARNGYSQVPSSEEKLETPYDDCSTMPA